MTATRDARTAPGAGVGERLAALRAPSGGPSVAGSLASATVVAPSLDPIALYAAAVEANLEAALWLHPSEGTAFVGIGRTWAVEAAGDARFRDAEAAWRDLLAGARLDRPDDAPPGAGPVLARRDGVHGPGTRPGRRLGPVRRQLARPARAPAVRDAGWRVRDRIARSTGPTTPRGAWTRAGGASPIARGSSARARTGSWRCRCSRRCGSTRSSPATRSGGGWSGCTPAPSAAAGSTRSSSPAGSGCGRRSSSTSRTRSAGSPRAPPRARRTRSGATAGRSSAPRRSASCGPRAGRSGPSPSRARSAVARTRPRTAALARRLLASEKDREEHAIVVDAIRDLLAPVADSLTIAPEPGVMTLRFVQHLVTEISGTLPEGRGLLALGERLHPTPAVGGDPRDVALALIDEHEGFDRGWYAGPVGLARRGRRRRAVRRAALRDRRPDPGDAVRGLRDRGRLRPGPGVGGVADQAARRDLGPGDPGGRAMSDARLLRAFAAELVAAGVTDAIVCPGSRSTPLALALRTRARAPGPRPPR